MSRIGNVSLALEKSRLRGAGGARTARKQGATTKSWRATFAAGAAALALLGSLLSATPAVAAFGAPDPETVRDALAAAGVLRAEGSLREARDGDASSPAEVSAAGLSMQSETDVLTMSPVAAGGAIELESGLVVFAHTQDASFALTSTEQGANAGYSVLTGPSAPSEFSYTFTVNGGPASFSPTEDGGLAVLDAEGVVVNLLAPAWAVDAAGVEVPTEYRVDGDTVTQIVQHSEENVYPIVADPRLRCDALWCTVEATRAETAAIADNALNAGILCTFVPNYGGAALCAGVVIGAWAAANAARAQGLCIGYRYWRINYTLGHVVAVPCYA